MGSLAQCDGLADCNCSSRDDGPGPRTTRRTRKFLVMVRLTGSWGLRMVAAFGTALLCAEPTASQHAAAGCPYDKLWIGSTCPRVHFRTLVREDGDQHRGCCIGGGREGQCPENCARQTVNADGSCSCGPCDPPQPPECTAGTGKVSLLEPCQPLVH